MKRIASKLTFAFLFVTLVCVSLYLGATPAKAATYSGTCGTNVNWTLDTETGEMVISGEGTMSNYSNAYSVPWTSYATYIKSITINDGVTSVGLRAFNTCRNLKSVTVADSVTQIADSAFNGCSSLESITLPFVGGSIKTETETYQYPLGYIFGSSYYSGGVSTSQSYYGQKTTAVSTNSYYIPAGLKEVTITGGNILRGAFYNCSSLTSITIPEGVSSIGEEAFYGCASLEKMVVPNGVRSIKTSTFKGCTNLADVTLPDSLISVADGAFSGCSSLVSIKIPANVQSFGAAFSNCTSLCKVYVTDIANWCMISFSSADANPLSNGADLYVGDDKITALVVPEGVTSIGDYAFYNCTSITEVTFSDSLVSVGQKAFYGCSAIEKVNVSGIGSWCGISFYDQYSNPTFYAKKLYVNNELLTDLVIPTGVTSIGGYAFYYCSDIISVSIPNSVEHIGASAFGYCTGITNIEVPSSVKSIYYGAFRACASLESITLPFVGSALNPSSTMNSFGFIFGDSSLGCTMTRQYYQYDNGTSKPGTTNSYYFIPTSLKSVTITGGKLYYGAFYNCSGLTEIILTDGVTDIGDYAFYCCSGITSIKIPNSVASIGNLAFKYCTNLQQVTFSGNVESIGEAAFSACSALKSVVIPDGVTVIKYNAFSSCTSLESVTLGSNLTTIEYYAFSSCSALTSITIPSSVTSIGDGAFQSCSKLGAVYVEDIAVWCGINFGASPISNYDLYVGGKIATDIAVPEGAGKVGDFAFYGCKSITSVKLPASVESIGDYAFVECLNLRSINIPEGVTSIGNNAFNYCTALVSVDIPDAVTSIGANAFYRCSNLERVTLGKGVKSIGASAFFDCSALVSVKNNSNVESIGADAFIYCTKLTGIDLGDGLLSIGSRAFYDCQALTAINIPNGVESVGQGAFYNCYNITSIVIPDSVTTLGADTFKNCTGLKTVVIGNGVTSIEEGVLNGCSSLERLTIPFVGDSIKTASSTYQYPFGYIFGDSNFTGSIAITQSYYGSSTSSTTSTKYYIPTSLTEVTVTGGNILKGAFQGCYKLTKVDLIGTVSSIQSGAFSGCSGMKSVNVCDSVTSIGLGAFASCNLESITLPFVGDKVKTSGATYQYPFGYIFGTTSYATFGATTQKYITTGVNSYANTIYGIPTSLKNVTITGGHILYGAFWNCKNLTNITIGDNVKSVHQYAFYGCSGLESLTIPFVGDSIKTENDTYQYPLGYIFGMQNYDGSDAVVQNYRTSSSNTSTTFYIPTSLKQVTITGGNILYGAFYNCTNLTSITLPDGIDIIKHSAFYNCTSLKNINVPEGVAEIEAFAFYNCRSLENIKIPASVTSIGIQAFQNCTSLTALTLQKTVSGIGGLAFDGCTNLTLYVFDGSYAHTYAQSNSVPYKVITPDVDGDGTLTNSDITLAIRFFVGWNISSEIVADEFDPKTYDLNCDGKLNNRDVIYSIRKLAGWDEE